MFGSASHFCCCFFLVHVGEEGVLGVRGSVLSTMAGRVTRLHQLFMVRHVQTAAPVSLNVGGISFKRQSMVCEGERETGEVGVGRRGRGAWQGSPS